MFLLAWSFALNAVDYVRRKRITRLIWSFVEEAALLGGRSVLICTVHKRQHSSFGENETQWLMNFLNGVEVERCVYETNAVQIIIKHEKIILQEDAWNWMHSYWNFDVKYRKDRVSFLVQLALCTRQSKRGQVHSHLDEPSTVENVVSDTKNECDSSEENESILCSDEDLCDKFMDYLEDNAHLIAQHKNSRYLYYECTLSVFQEILYLWTEGKLYSNGTQIDEIYTVDVPLSHIYGRSISQSRQLSNLSENESSKKSCELSSSHISLSSSYNSSEDPPFSLLEMLFLKELGTNLTTQFSSESHLNKLTADLSLDSTTKHFITGWGSVREICHPSSSSTYNHLSLHRKDMIGSSQRVKSLSPVKKNMASSSFKQENVDDKSSINVMATQSFSKEIVPIYLKQFREENEFSPIDECNVSQDEVTNAQSDDSQRLCWNNNENGDSAKSTNSCFGGDDLESALKFCDNNAYTSESSEINTSKNPDTSQTLLADNDISILHNMRPAKYIPHIEEENIKSTKFKSSPERTHHYYYVPTAEFAKHQNFNNTTEKYRCQVGCHQFLSTPPLGNNRPKYFCGWRFSRDKIARYHQFALRRRLSGLAAANNYETSRFLNQFLKMNLRARNGLSASAICLNFRSCSSSSPLPSTRGNAISAINSFAANTKQRSQSFPRRHFFNTKNRGTNVNDTQNVTRTILNPSSKPPAILIYTDDQKDLFSKIVASLDEILPRDVYTVRDLTTCALKYQPWYHEHCVCLIVTSIQQLDDQAWEKLQNYFNNSGKMLFVCQNTLLSDLTSCSFVKKQINILKSVFERKTCSGSFGKDFESFLKKSFRKLAKSQKINEVFHNKDTAGGYQFTVVLCKNIDQPFLLYMQTSEHHRVRSCALFSDVTTDELLRNNELVADALSRLGIDIIEREIGAKTKVNMPRLSFGYLLCQNDRLIHELKGLTYGKTFNSTFALIFQHFSHRECEQILPEPSADYLPIFVCRRAEPSEELKDGFDYVTYFDILKTKRLGRILLYVPTCTTTIDIAKSFATNFPQSDGILITTGYQTCGRGRSGNIWLSPVGCAVLQFNFNIPFDSELAKSITFVQHIASVAIVDAILTRVGDENFPIKIKWPNDIYYKRDFKLGGILVIASQQGDQFGCSIGAGINVANTKPTICINNFLATEKALVIEELLAEVMNKFEYYLNVFVHQGKAELIKKYVSYWMHSGEEVTIMHENGRDHERVTIRSLDENGFLSVESKETARVFSVQDNGNSFDIMHGLIQPKRDY